MSRATASIARRPARPWWRTGARSAPPTRSRRRASTRTCSRSRWCAWRTRARSSARCSTTSSITRASGARRSSTRSRCRCTARLIYRLGDVLVYGPLKNRFGLTRIRVGYTAGEAIGPEIFRFYRALGINLKQLYGQTEASVYITAQPDGEIYADTVGKPNIDVDVKIAENGEVLFKSPGVFLGYYKDPEKTAETKTPDGWVRTGDAGFFDPKTGHLKIIDRAKDVGRLKDGTLFAPKYIENKLKFYPNIKEAVAIGDGRDDVTVMLNIDLVAVGCGPSATTSSTAPTRSSPAIRRSTTCWRSMSTR